jgi:nitroreductase
MENQTRFALHPLLQKRWSPRAFSSEPISGEVLGRVLEAALFAPSASNEQPWRFVVGLKGTPAHEAILDSLVEFNQLWAVLAPVLIVACGKTVANAKPDQPNPNFRYDTGQAVAHLSFQAMHEGLFVHQMTGFDPAKAAQNLAIEPPFVPISVIALGYMGSPDQLPEKLKAIETGPKKRFGFEEMVFEGEFGNPFKLA